VTPAENQEAFKLIRQHTTTPLAVGEIFNTIWDAKDLIQNQLIDYIRATIVGAGGITHLRRIADLASMYQIRTGCHGATDLARDHGHRAAFRHLGAQFRHSGIHAPHAETDAVFPHDYTFDKGMLLCGRHTRPRRRHRRGARRQVSLQARLPPRRKAGRRHHVELVDQPRIKRRG
jgi:mannonate dehydratase